MGETWVQALSEVDLKIHSGDLLALSGPSGSGKTTLLNLIGCLDHASTGQVFLDGVELGGLSSKELAAIRAEQIGFVFQSFNLIPVLSAVENVEVALRLSGRPVARAAGEEALVAVGLGVGVDWSDEVAVELVISSVTVTFRAGWSRSLSLVATSGVSAPPASAAAT